MGIPLYPNQAEAIAAILPTMRDGQRMTVHTDECALVTDDGATCTCTPMIVTKGARA